MSRPSRAKMCNWLAARIRAESSIIPTNPANIAALALNARRTQGNLQDLALIAGELGWHADASLDFAWELIQEYDARRESADTGRAE